MVDNRNTFPQWIAVDLDGTLAYYDSNRGLSLDYIGPPITSMLVRVLGWLREGKTVKIFTARAAMPEQIALIHSWCKINLGVELEVTNAKDPGMITMYDDRCVLVEHNTGKILAFPSIMHIDTDACKTTGD